MEQKSSSMKYATLRYALINISYFAVFCGIHAYSSVFLLSKGFSNTMIGMVLAIANIMSVICQPLVAGLIDKPGPLTNRNVSMGATILMIIGSLVLYFLDNAYVVIFIVYALVYMIQMVYQPLIIAMNFEYRKAGANINFGLSRGLGSFGFAITSVIFGRVVTERGVATIQMLDVFLLVASFVLLFTFALPKGTNVSAEETKIEGVAHNNFFDFARTYPRFMFLILGSVCFFFAHNVLNDFLIQIIMPIGGNEAKMGYAIFIAAALELPTMAAIGVIKKKISCSNLLVISGIVFFVKTLIMLLATNMTMVYISEICQLGAYALFIPTSAYYVEEIMQELDKVKGQAYINVSITLGGVFSNLICGRILDKSGVFSMLSVCLAVTAMGLLIVWISVKGGKNISC